MNCNVYSGELLNKRKKARYPAVIMSAIIIILTALSIFYLLFGYTYIVGRSMENTIFTDQRAFLLIRGYTIERGDIVTIDLSEDNDPRELIKRVIALPGDKFVYVCDRSKTYIDLYLCKSGETVFYKLDEPYIKERMTLRSSVSYGNSVNYIDFYERSAIEKIDITKKYSGKQEELRQILINKSLTVPKNYFYFLGDNRNVSSDARNSRIGMKSLDDINAKMLKILDADSPLARFLSLMF